MSLSPSLACLRLNLRRCALFPRWSKPSGWTFFLGRAQERPRVSEPRAMMRAASCSNRADSLLTPDAANRVLATRGLKLEITGVVKGGSRAGMKSLPLLKLVIKEGEKSRKAFKGREILEVS
ncbi:hypothetical protein GGTG_14143 [Gaeumannomyces tritici R3-111a-1]|uniref:Uncharacterized protein n=1 Tax=Gaeumannomyces tritici (strain R3-111a-1) TaxID=644352 RepID=J3PKS6_GAET3|nr:hypothetical protein GGTG_14143 [Gaeumannomyces tritici R3-111a-1]EJT68276.1 hypothetical protein GGTG_14143 [Gaeumannomyces tritici R3-111a-1]